MEIGKRGIDFILAHCYLSTCADLSTRDLVGDKEEVSPFHSSQKTMNVNEFTNIANRFLYSSKSRAGGDLGGRSELLSTKCTN